MDNNPIPNLDNSSFNSVIDVLERLYNLGLQRGEEKIPTILLKIKARKIIIVNRYEANNTGNSL